jgi:hypothetical protein
MKSKESSRRRLLTKPKVRRRAVVACCRRVVCGRDAILGDSTTLSEVVACIGFAACRAPLSLFRGDSCRLGCRPLTFSNPFQGSLLLARPAGGAPGPRCALLDEPAVAHHDAVALIVKERSARSFAADGSNVAEARGGVGNYSWPPRCVGGTECERETAWRPHWTGRLSDQSEVGKEHPGLSGGAY